MTNIYVKPELVNKLTISITHMYANINTGVLLMVFMLALFLGSFYNVVGLRTLKNESISFPPSHCTKCNHRLKVLDLIPVVSYITLGGKCRYCKEHISKLYIFGEMLTAVSYVIVVYKYGLTAYAVPHLVLATVLAISTITDLKEMIVPDIIIFTGLITNLIVRIMLSLMLGEKLLTYILGSIICYTILNTLRILSKGGMGGADIKLYGLIGLTLGVELGIKSFYLASLAGVVYNIPNMVKKKTGRKTEIAFIPFITVGVLLTYIINIIVL